MRQVLSWRFFAALLCVAALGAGAFALTRADDDFVEAVGAAPRTRRADLVSNVAAIERGADFSMTPFGTVSGTLVFDLLVRDDQVVRLQVFPGTPGEITCPDDLLGTPFACAVIAELLGDSIVSFRLVPVKNLNIRLPAIVGFEDGYAELSDGWELPYLSVIDRSQCGGDFASFTELMNAYGTDFESIYSLVERQIVRVENCGARAGVAAPASTAVPAVPVTTAAA